MQLDRYILREIAGPLTLIGMVLVVLFGSYSAARFLSDAVGGLLSVRTVVLLVLLRLLIALEVLIPVALYLSVVAGLGRLYADSEILAMEAAGIGPARLRRNVLLFSCAAALLVAGLSLLVRPWAYGESYRIKAAAQADFDLARLEAGHFYPFDGTVLFMQGLDPAERRASGIFIRRVKDGVQEVTYARKGFQVAEPGSGEKRFVLLDGRHYRLGEDQGRERIVSFDRYLFSFQPNPPSPAYQRKAASIWTLAHSKAPEDLAEFQWRLSTAFSTVLLGLLGIPLSRGAPRKGRNARLFLAVILFALYYNLSLLAKNWVEGGVVGPVPGLWWTVALLGAVVFLLLKNSGGGFHFLRPRPWGKS